MRCARVLAMLVLAAAPAAAQTGAPQVPLFHSRANLVALNVSVVDASSHYVSGLQASDFAVYEDGVPQKVEFFESSAVPIDLIVLLDTSASMTDKMATVHEAALGFLRTLRPGDRGAVVAFSDHVAMLQALTTDRAALETAVLSTQAHGATALDDAIYIALKEFGRTARQAGQVRRQAIAVLSDGEDTASLVGFDDVRMLARQTGVSIYPIGLESSDDLEAALKNHGHRYLNEAQFSLQTLARETGAEAFFPADAGDLKTIYARIASELANQYSIGYVPGDSQLDGRFRRVVVQVVSRPRVTSRTRLGYVASSAPATVAESRGRSR
ncbi:MAG TPA: VWA domain-containing protein [Vicinamibacterales bacterium]|nr:VWA domain-containing protein [Vicinamibacterales bacterium]